jgi:tetratricopeptide (TPR) repeat protein
MSSRRGREVGGLLVLCLLALAARAAAPPAELTKGQKGKLAQRDRLVKSLPELVGKRQFHQTTDAQERIAALEKEVLGETDGRVVASLQKLAGWREALGQFVKAIRVRKEVVRLQQKRLGKDHWQATDARLDLQDSRRLAAMSREDRAALAQTVADNGRGRQLSQRKYREALEIAVKVLAVRRKVRGKKHPDYAQSLNNQAMLYREMGEPRKALPLLREARDLRRKVLGEKHPDYARSLSNLASLYQAMEERGKALPLLLEALRLRRKVLGERHSDYASSLNNLASLYQAMGEHGKASPGRARRWVCWTPSWRTASTPWASCNASRSPPTSCTTSAVSCPCRDRPGDLPPRVTPGSCGGRAGWPSAAASTGCSWATPN